MRTRAYRRHQRARHRARHIRVYHEVDSRSAADGAWPKDIATRHPLACPIPRCHICHYEKLTEPRRAREKRAWIAAEIAD